VNIAQNGEMNVRRTDTGSLTFFSEVQFSQLLFSRTTRSSKFCDHISYTEFYAKKKQTKNKKRKMQAKI